MEVSYPNWKSLPVEVLQNILQLAAKHNSVDNTCNFALVCQAWLQPSQFVLYSKVSIHNLQQLQKFFNTIKHNTNLGRVVKKIHIHYSNPRSGILKFFTSNEKDAIEVEMVNLLDSLFLTYLPNLERINTYGISPYASVLNALINSQLKRLKLLEAPKDETEESEKDYYVNCVLLIKDRIQKITILKDDRHLDETRALELPFDRLYDNLSQFSEVTDLHIERETQEDIEAFEYIVKPCKALKELTFSFPTPDDDTNSIQNSNISYDVISKFNPNSSIEILDGYIYVSNNTKILLTLCTNSLDFENLTLQ